MKNVILVQFLALVFILIPQAHAQLSQILPEIPLCDCIARPLSKYEVKSDTVRGEYCEKESCVEKNCLHRGEDGISNLNTGVRVLEDVDMEFCKIQKAICREITSDENPSTSGIYIPSADDYE